MTFQRRLPALVIALVLAGLSLSACGDKDTNGAAPDTKESSAVADAELTKANFADTIIAAQQKAGTNHIKMVIKAGGQTVTSEGDQVIGTSIEDNASSMTMDYGDAGPGTAKMVIVDGQFYMNFGELTGNKYAKADLTDANDPFTKQLGPMLEQLDISKQIEQMSSAVTSVKKAGDIESIDGVDTQPYEVVIDTSKVGAFDAIPAEGRGIIPDSLTYTMHLGADGLLRRMTYGFSGMTGTVDLTKWGEPVDIKAPSPDEVSDKDLATLLNGPSSI